MNSETWSILFLAGYLLIGVVAVFLNYIRSGHSWQVWMLYIVERIHVGLMWKWRSNRRCNFPTNSAAIIIANHRSPTDPMLVWMNHHLADPKRRFRLMRFIMTLEYYNLRGVHWLCKNLDSIALERNGNDLVALKLALKKLKEGKLVPIFPEGQLNKDGTNIQKAGPGVAWIALHARVPVYPVYIHGSPQGKSMILSFATPSRVRVVYGDPIDLSEYFGRKKTQKLLKEVTDKLMMRLAELGGVEYAGVANPEPEIERFSQTSVSA